MRESGVSEKNRGFLCSSARAFRVSRADRCVCWAPDPQALASARESSLGDDERRRLNALAKATALVEAALATFRSALKDRRAVLGGNCRVVDALAADARAFCAQSAHL